MQSVAFWQPGWLSMYITLTRCFEGLHTWNHFFLKHKEKISSNPHLSCLAMFIVGTLKIWICTYTKCIIFIRVYTNMHFIIICMKISNLSKGGLFEAHLYFIEQQSFASNANRGFQEILTSFHFEFEYNPCESCVPLYSSKVFCIPHL